MNRENPISVAVVEDDEAFLHELGCLLESSSKMELVGKFSTAAMAMSELVALDPDIVLIDLDLPDGLGTDVIKQLSRVGLHTEFLVFTVYDDDQHLFPALEAGAVGYILKGQLEQSELIELIEEVIGGGAPMSLSIARRVLKYFNKQPKQDRQERNLSKREQEVLMQLAKGYGAKKVAQELDIAYGTVRCHQKNIYKKLQVNSLVEALSTYKNIW